jgi:predicted nucleic acid-binding Zn ribbon protein
MHFYTYECTECGGEYEVIAEEDEGFSPGHFVFCGDCNAWCLHLPVEHVEVESKV